jgi:hypothetical protein
LRPVRFRRGELLEVRVLLHVGRLRLGQHERLHRHWPFSILAFLDGSAAL